MRAIQVDRMSRCGDMAIRNYPSRHLGFDVTRNSAIRSADPENPTIEPNMKCILGHMEPPFGGRGGRRGSAMIPFERAMAVSYRLSIVTVALSVTIWPQFAIECLRLSNQQGVGHFGPKFPGVPLGVDLGLSDCCNPNTGDFLPARRYASAGNSDRNVSVCLSVRLSVCHAPVLCQNEES